MLFAGARTLSCTPALAAGAALWARGTTGPTAGPALRPPHRCARTAVSPCQENRQKWTLIRSVQRQALLWHKPTCVCMCAHMCIYVFPDMKMYRSLSVETYLAILSGNAP